jgi:hypothetical protein
VPAGARTAQTANLFLLEDLDDATRTSELARSDLDALQTVAGWIKSFIVMPNDELGRAGPICPFVPVSLERKTLWLAPEHAAACSSADVVELVTAYEELFLGAQPTDADDAIYKAIVVVFTDLSPALAGQLFDDVLQELAIPSYVGEGFVMGGSYAGNEAGAIYNPSFRPFTSPVPFFLIRPAVITDWKFFVDDEGWLDRWALRYGASGAETLGRVRRLPWRGQARLSP